MTEYHIGDLLSITTGRLVSPDRMDGVYRICDGVTGQENFTHQLLRVAREIKSWLIEHHPWLAEIQAPDFKGPGEVPLWLARMVAEHGERHEVPPMPNYVGRDALAELVEKVGPERVIPVVVDPA